jgi:hypothetical protein
LLFLRRYLSGISFGFSALACFFYLSGFLEWVYGLGGDSFLEVKNNRLSDAVFWTKNFLELLPGMRISGAKVIILLSVLATTLATVVLLTLILKPRIRKVYASALLVLIFYTFYLGYSGFERGRAYAENLEKGFSQHVPSLTGPSRADLFVYIGESTSTLNMGLYGYILDTTPELQRLADSEPGFFFYRNVRSTDSHTTPSLIRAFSLSSTDKSGVLVRWGLGRVLEQAGMRIGSIRNEKTLTSGKGGSFNDREILKQALRSSGVVFFHSYAGHWPYSHFIDDAFSSVIDIPRISFEGIFGTRYSGILEGSLKSSREDYDQAIAYIDRNLALAIAEVRARPTPAVFLYFSDHGESVYTKFGHDSSKYIDEMTTVPLIVYFNKAYREEFPEIVKMYDHASRDTRLKLLDQVAPTILELLALRPAIGDLHAISSPIDHPRPIIMERELIGGRSSIALQYNESDGLPPHRPFGGTLGPTYVSVLTQFDQSGAAICYHRANSLAKALRGASVARCLEVDVVVNGDRLDVTHPPLPATGLVLSDILDIAERREIDLWIDAKNIDKPHNCLILADELTKEIKRLKRILVEFPPTSVGSLAVLSSCISRLRQADVRISYYVSTEPLVECAEDARGNQRSCASIKKALDEVLNFGAFSDISFDIRGLGAIDEIPVAKKIRWNTWAIKPQDFHKIHAERFGFVIIDTSDDPNSY